MITYFISPSGNDQAPGTTPEQAFATLTRAQQATRQYAGKAPITIYLHAGTYVLDETFSLTEQDSGTDPAPIVYRAYQQEHVRIIGAQTLTPSALATFTHAQHITFQNITFENTPSNGIVIEGGTHIQIAGCTLCNIGNTGILINGGTHHRVQSCNVSHTDGVGISVSGGNRQTLTRAEHSIDNCNINNIAQRANTPEPSIQISGVGIRVSHNHIHNCPHSAILLTGNEHLIEYNHIHHVCLETTDGGAFYMGRDWTERGIRIQYNYFHDVGDHESKGICLDDCASGAIIIGNVFVRCPNAVFIGGGRNHRVDNNIFVQCEPALHIDGRGLDKHPEWHNLIYTTLKPRFEALNPLEPPYSNYYPELHEVARYYQAKDGIPPEGNLILRNISYQSTWHKIHWNATPKIVALQNNLIDEDPHFIDVTNDNYKLHEDSPAYEIGIKPIPFDQIGLYPDSSRPHHHTTSSPN
jgi:hypothetical protein